MTVLFGLMKLTKDAEIRTVENGIKVANLSLAYEWGGPDENNNRPSTEVHALLWGREAEETAPLLRKGRQHHFVLNNLRVGGPTENGQALVADVLQLELMNTNRTHVS